MARRVGHARPANEAHFAGLGLQRRVGHDAEPTTLSQAKQQYISKAALTRRNYKSTPLRWIRSSSVKQMVDKKVDDRLARFNCILGARDHAYHPATPSV
jgi:hypothetical protein